MADVARTASISTQINIIAALRWRVFCNSLRTFSGQLHFLGLVVVGTTTGLFAAAMGIGLGVACHIFIVRGRYEMLVLPLWAVFSLWQFMPLLMAMALTSFDLRNLLRFPLRFSVFFVLSLVYGLFDPPAIAALLWLACMAMGIMLARPNLAGWTLLVFAIFAVANLLLSRMVFYWLERLLARRRSREALLAIFFLCLLGAQLIAALEPRWAKRVSGRLTLAMPILQVLPPGLAGKALAGAAQGHSAVVFTSGALLAAYALGAGLVLSRRLRAQYRGEDLGETQAPVVLRARPEPARAIAGSRVSFTSAILPAAVAAVVEKEMRYLFRNSAMLLNLVLPVILIVFFALAWSGPRDRPDVLGRVPDLAFPAAVGYMFLILAPIAHNSFAYDGRGVQVLFVAPVHFRDVLLGKNLLLGLVLAVETLLVWLAVSLLVRPPRPMIVLATLAGLLFAALVHLMVGNWLSLRFPRRFEFGQYRRRVSGMTMLVGLGAQLVVLGLATVVFVLAQLSGRMWLATVLFLALAGATLVVYSATLDRFSRLAANCREVLAEQLVR